MNTNTQLLRDENVFPSTEVLRQVLGANFSALEELTNAVVEPSQAVDLEWRYYKDGKAWLGKGVHKKKTVFWLSVWEDFFQISFFFTEKTGVGVADLDIAGDLKREFAQAKIAGRLIPLIVRVSSQKQVQDVLRIMEYKKGLK